MRRRTRMRLRPGRRALTWGLVALVLLNACATVPQAGTGGSGRPEAAGPRPGSEEWETLDEAREAELDSALAGMWGVASEVREVGAVLEFTFWTERGSFTLVSLRRQQPGSAPGSAVAKESFASELRELLSTCGEGAPGAVHLTLRREETRWRADFKKDEAADFPQEAKTWPVRRVGARAEELQGLVTAGREVASRVWVPAGARVRWQVEISLDDERVTGLETRPPRSLPGGTSTRAAPELMGTWVNVLVPFMQGLGPRKVRMEWEGEHLAGTQQSRWKIVEAEVVRPPPPEPRNAAVALEYRAMHEQIQRQWREETRETFQAAGIFTAEQVALWVVGGWAARGVGVVMEAAAPTIARVLARGGTEAVGWFRTLLARAAPAERQAITRLMAKAETQGLEALTVAERSELRTLVTRLDELTTVKLSPGVKDDLRKLAREEFERTHPGLLQEVRGVLSGPCDVHHRLPLDFAHLFPALDVNAPGNLVAVEPRVHRLINKAWGVYTSRAGAGASATEVETVERIVRRNFEQWYSNARTTPASSEQLMQASQRALAEVEAFLVQVGK
jgi:hypothetical protein